ncbi:MAG: hypothetical protein WA001_00125 [Patescibacteria group bacterium]
MYERAKCIEFSSDETCPTCGRLTFAGAWYVAGDAHILLEGSCGSPRCNRALAAAVPCNPSAFGRPSMPTMVEPFISRWDACPHCGKKNSRLLVTRGERLVASECLFCNALRMPQLEGDEPETVRPTALAVSSR